MIPSYFEIEILAIRDKFVTQAHKRLKFIALCFRNPLRSCPTYRKLDLSAWKEGAPTFAPPPVVEHEATTTASVHPFATTTALVHPFVTTSRPLVTPVRPQTTARPPHTSFRPITIGRPVTTGRPFPQSPTTVRPPLRPSTVWPQPVISSSRPPVISGSRPWPQGSPVGSLQGKEPISAQTAPQRPITFPVSTPQRPVGVPVSTPQRPISFPASTQSHRPGPSYRPTTQRPATTSSPFIFQQIPGYYPPPILPPFG